LGIPWRQVQKKDHLVLGVVGGDPNYPLHPPVIRALGSAVSKLTAAGHNVKILSDTPSIYDACQVAFKFFALDNTNVCMQHIQRSGEPPIYSLRTSGPDYSDHKFALEELFDLNVARLEFVAAWEKVWLENELDAIIMPGAANTAVPHDTYGHPPYTVLWNLVDVSRPSCVDQAR
jgi:Asp-tRNA(Asn)/Glu-tRNA(Gln) amidotransferase A subunit family amidase